MTPHSTSFPKDQIKILLLEGIHPSAAEHFRSAGYPNVEILPKALSEEELLKVLPSVHLLGIRSKTQITPKVIKKANRLLSIGCFCIGTNQVHLESAMDAGITVFNSPYSNTRSVAELVLASAIMLIRKIPQKNNAAHRGEWMKDHHQCHEIRGKTLGIVGYGHIGSQVSVLAEALGMRVIFHDIEPKLPLGNASQAKDLVSLCQQSDIITFHVPGGQGTHLLLSKDILASLAPGKIILNLSRGTVVDIDALHQSINQGIVVGAALDVFPVEPEAKGERFESPLQGLDQVILTPHIGGSTEEAQVNIAQDVSRKLIQLLELGTTTGSHTVPELSLPVQRNTHRILHIHRNQPGIISAINKAVAELGVNIAGQYLKTNEHIGYVVLDIEAGRSKKVLQLLKDIPHTIRTRLLY